MSTFKNLEEAKQFFMKDRFATENGITLDEIGDDWAKASVTLTDFISC
jgi:acyl-CoA thioesterase